MYISGIVYVFSPNFVVSQVLTANLQRYASCKQQVSSLNRVFINDFCQLLIFYYFCWFCFFYCLFSRIRPLLPFILKSPMVRIIHVNIVCFITYLNDHFRFFEENMIGNEIIGIFFVCHIWRTVQIICTVI